MWGGIHIRLIQKYVTGLLPIWSLIPKLMFSTNLLLRASSIESQLAIYRHSPQTLQHNKGKTHFGKHTAQYWCKKETVLIVAFEHFKNTLHYTDVKKTDCSVLKTALQQFWMITDQPCLASSADDKFCDAWRKFWLTGGFCDQCHAESEKKKDVEKHKHKHNINMILKR